MSKLRDFMRSRFVLYLVAVWTICAIIIGYSFPLACFLAGKTPTTPQEITLKDIYMMLIEVRDAVKASGYQTTITLAVTFFATMFTMTGILLSQIRASKG